MARGFQSKVDIGKEFEELRDNIKAGINETTKISKEVYEAVESKGIYSTTSLDDQLTSQLQEMKKEQERLEYIKQGGELKEEKRQNTNDKVKEDKTHELER